MNKFVGNPRDTIDIIELTKGISNKSCTSSNASKRSAPVAMRILCLLWEFVKMFIIANPTSADECVCAMTEGAMCFYSWLDIE